MENLMDLLMLVVMILAVEQISHYLTEGEIFTNPRAWILGKNDFLGQLVYCFECTSFWVSVAVVLLVWPFERWAWNVVAIFAILVPAQFIHGARQWLFADDGPTQKRLPPPGD